MNAKRCALVALGVGLVAWGLDALVRTKAQGYGRPTFHPEATPPPAGTANPGGRVPAPWERLGWTEGAFNPGGHFHAPWEQAEGLGVCQQCGNLPDTPGHELGCPAGRAQYGHELGCPVVPEDASWEQAFVGVGWTEGAYRRLMAHYGAQVQPPTAQLRPEDFTP